MGVSAAHEDCQNSSTASADRTSRNGGNTCLPSRHAVQTEKRNIGFVTFPGHGFTVAVPLTSMTTVFPTLKIKVLGSFSPHWT